MKKGKIYTYKAPEKVGKNNVLLVNPLMNTYYYYYY
jgi:hypothetical protein